MYDLRRNPLNYISILFRGFHINRFMRKDFQVDLFGISDKFSRYIFCLSQNNKKIKY